MQYRPHCSRCGEEHALDIPQSVNAATQPELRDRIRNGELFTWTCPHCGTVNLLKVPFLYHDPAEHLMLVLTDAPVNAEGVPEGYTGRQVRSVGDLIEKIKIYRYSGILDYEEYEMEDADIGIVCYGGTTRAAMEAVNECRDMGYNVGMFRPVTLWPFPEHELVERAKQLRRLIVVEHNYGQVKLTVEGIIKGDTRVEFIGKVNGTAISPKEIIKKIEEGEDYDA